MTFANLRARAAYVGLLILMFLAVYLIVGDDRSTQPPFEGAVLVVEI
jgi:hypothetical protein